MIRIGPLAFISALLYLCCLGCFAQQNVNTPMQSIDSCFIGGKFAYHREFKSKIEFPDHLRKKENSGVVYFEVFIDTLGNINEFKILKSLHPILDNEVKEKIYATNGMWKILRIDGKNEPYRIFDRVYFELR